MNIAPWAVGALTPTLCGKVTWPSLDGPTDGGGKSLRRGGRSLSIRGTFVMSCHLLGEAPCPGFRHSPEQVLGTLGSSGNLPES